MLNTTQITNSFTAVRERPVSHGAALAVLGSLAWVAHEGIVAWVPGALATALTVLFLAVAVLQWLGLGRKDACDAERDQERSDAVITQAWIFGAIETVLYAAGGLALLSAEGVAVYTWWGVAIAAAAAAACALINFRIKWVSCDQVGAVASRGPTGGQRVHEALFSSPALPALPSNTDTVVSFDLEKAIREKTARMEAAEAAALQAAPKARPAPVRLRNAAKRIRMRAKRAAAA